MRDAHDITKQTPYSDPGRHAALFATLATDPEQLSATARNVIVHYRASGHDLPEEMGDDINARWLERILSLDQLRHPQPLTEPRELPSRVQGCCRDHTLFCVGALRASGVPARSRVGFAGYFVDGWHHDHVVVEAWIEERWRRLLWDSWGRMGPPDAPVSETDARWLDSVAELLLASDAGDNEAEATLLDRYRSDSGLHPGPTIVQASPHGAPPIEVDLAAERLGYMPA